MREPIGASVKHHLARGTAGLVLALALGAPAPTASAAWGAVLAQTPPVDPTLARAADALQEDPVYVDPAAGDILDPAAADRLRTALGSMDAGPVFVAVLPAGAGSGTGGLDALLLGLRREVGREGVYLAVAGSMLRAMGTTDEGGEGIGTLAAAAVRENRGRGAEAVLTALLDKIEAAGGPSGSDEGPVPAERAPAPSRSPVPLLLVLIAAGGILTAVMVSSTRKRRAREAAEFDEVRATVTEDLVSLGEALRAVDLDVRMPGADHRAAEDYERALTMYQQASAALDRARRATDVAAVTSAVDEGRYAVESAKARLEGREPPQRRLPCFFDPRHGHATTEVEWAPPDGAPRTIPVCAADAQRIADGVDPEPRRVGVGGARVPYWDAPGYYGPWYGGFYGGGGGLLQGFLLGSILSGGWGGGWGSGHAASGGGWGDGEAGDGGGGGDFGGGDFGGGDFGGGDFGGGDF